MSFYLSRHSLVDLRDGGGDDGGDGGDDGDGGGDGELCSILFSTWQDDG